MKTLTTAQQIDALIRKDGGVTLQCYSDSTSDNIILDIFNPTGGYQIGCGNILTEKYTALSSDKLHDCIRKLQAREGNFLGFWYDSESGTLDVDDCIWTSSKKTALTLACENNELAIWDWENSTEIETGLRNK